MASSSSHRTKSARRVIVFHMGASSRHSLSRTRECLHNGQQLFGVSESDSKSESESVCLSPLAR